MLEIRKHCLGIFTAWSLYLYLLLWGFKSSSLKTIQKKVIRTITCSKYNAHTDPLFKKLGLLKVEDIFKISKIKFYYRFLNQTLPINIQKLPLFPNSEIYTRDTRYAENLFVNRYSHAFAKNCLRYDLPETINSLPIAIRDKFYTHSYQGLTRYAKKFYIQSYQEVCDTPNCYICTNNN